MRHTHTHTHRPFRTESLFCAEMGTENDQKSYSTLCWARFHSLCISFDHCCYMSQNVNNVSSPNAGETKHLDGRYNVNSYVMQNDCEKDLEWQREGRKARIVIKWIYIHELIWSIVHEDSKRFNLCLIPNIFVMTLILELLKFADSNEIGIKSRVDGGALSKCHVKCWCAPPLNWNPLLSSKLTNATNCIFFLSRYCYCIRHAIVAEIKLEQGISLCCDHGGFI